MRVTTPAKAVARRMTDDRPIVRLAPLDHQPSRRRRARRVRWPPAVRDTAYAALAIPAADRLDGDAKPLGGLADAHLWSWAIPPTYEQYRIGMRRLPR